MARLALYGVMLSLMAGSVQAQNEGYYRLQPLVADQAKYEPLWVEPRFVNAWGIAIRPAGKGGHFWVSAGQASYEFVGDVQASSDTTLRVLHQDTLHQVSVPGGERGNFATGVVFSESKDAFVISQPVPNGEAITAPAKFLFASDSGVISAWTERKNADESVTRPPHAVPVIDARGDGAQFFGLAMDSGGHRLYAADFGAHPGIRVYDGAFKPLPITFDMPFDRNNNGRVDGGEYAPFNIQLLPTAKGPHLFVTYAKTTRCKLHVSGPLCVAGSIVPGEEDVTRDGQGKLAEFTEDGKLVSVWPDAGALSAPWGLAVAPKGFGPASEYLLVGNFGSGRIAVFDRKTRRFVGKLRGKSGSPVVIPKLWGLVFGNGESLGDSNALYYAAGPAKEKHGVFGSIRFVPETAAK